MEMKRGSKEKIKKEVYTKMFNIKGCEKKNYKSFEWYIKEIFSRVKLNFEMIDKAIDETIEKTRKIK